MSVKLLTEHYLDFLSFKGGCTGSSESTHVKMSDCWKSHVVAQICFDLCTPPDVSRIYKKNAEFLNGDLCFHLFDINRE